MKASFFSPEHSPMELHQTNFIQKAIGKNFWKEVNGIPRVTEDDILRYKDWANEKLYLTGPEMGQGATWDWILDKFKEVYNLKDNQIQESYETLKKYGNLTGCSIPTVMKKAFNNNFNGNAKGLLIGITMGFGLDIVEVEKED